MPNPMLRYGLSLIVDEHGVALRGTAAVYAADIKLTDLDLDGEILGQPATGATGIMLDRCAEWLNAQAGSLPSTTPPEPPSLPPDAEQPDVPAPDSGPSRPSRRAVSRPQRSSGRVLASATDRVERVVDPAVGDLQDDAVSLRENPPANRGSQGRKPRRRLS